MTNQTNYSNNFTFPVLNSMPLDIIVFGTTLYTLIFILGVSGNAMVIYVLMKQKELRNFTNYLLANHAVADMMVLFTCVPTALHDLFAKERWYFGEIMCHLMAFIENCMGNASILSIFLITIERYYVICRPLKVKSVMTPSRTLNLILIIWFICITVNLPFIFLTEYKKIIFYDKKTEEYKCSTKSPNELSFYYLITVTFIVYVLIGIVLVGMFYKISKSLNNSTRLLQSSANKHCISDLTISTETNSVYKKGFKSDSETRMNHLIAKNSLQRSSISSINFKNNLEKFMNLNNTLERYIKPRKQLIYMLMCVIIVFYVCLFPLKIWHLVLMFVAHKPYFPKVITLRHYWYFSITFRTFFYMNSFINPILYNCLSKKFRNAFKKMFLFKICFGNNGLDKNNHHYGDIETKHSYLL